MERAVGLERTYNLGDYKSLKVSDFVSDIPEELALNEEFMSAFKSMQIVAAEKLYYGYAELAGVLGEAESTEEKVDILANIESELYTKLLGLMTQKDSKEETK